MGFASGRRAVFAATMLGMMAGIAGRSEAGLLLSEVGVQFRVPNVDTITQDFGTRIVDPEAIFPVSNPLTVRVTDDQFILENLSPGTTVSYTGGPTVPFFGYSLTNLDGPAFIGATLNPSSNFGGASPVVSFNATTVFLGFVGTTEFTPGERAIIDLEFAPVAAVPEPSLAILGASALPVGLVAWRRRCKATAA